jgi:HSP20 family molecular chaperone IbpA
VEHRDDVDSLSWNHKVTLGGSLDPDAVTARYADGRLTITVPRTPQAPSRRIDVV